jgi:hypothetical protein
MMTAIVDGNGGFNLSFNVPSTWLDGTSIDEEHLVVVAMTSDGSTVALTSFLVVAGD